MSDTCISEELDRIAREMKRPGANLEALSAEIDKLLGSALEPEDKYLARVWENGHRLGK